MVGMGLAYADTPDDVIAQATNDVVQRDSVLAAAPGSTVGSHIGVETTAARAAFGNPTAL